MKIFAFNIILQLLVVNTCIAQRNNVEGFLTDFPALNMRIDGQNEAHLLMGKPADCAHCEVYDLNLDFPKQEYFEISPYDFSLNNLTLAKFRYPNINGMGMQVSIKEELFDTTAIDLKPRIQLTGSESQNTDQHATSIAVQIAGAGNSDRTGLGVAPQAFVSSSSFYDLRPDDNSIFRNRGISVQNHSYGTKIENQYGELAAAYDAQTYELKELVHVFSSGNSGLEASEEGTYAGIAGFANLTGNFKMSKNTLSVGALNAMEQVVDRSSKGPAYDGRVKPELVAYALNGTSDAAALVSGTALLLQQHYKQKKGMLPRSDLIRAVLIAGANDVHLPGVDFATGYGSLNASSSLDILEEGRYVEASVSGKEVFRQPISIPQGATKLRMALSWIDLPAGVGAASALIHDLDLRLISPSGNTVMPWILNAEATEQSLNAPATRGEDHLNNNEFISIQDLEPGVYTIEVRGAISEGISQAFAVAYTFSQSENFEWEYPRTTDALVTGNQIYVRWDSTLSQNTADLEYNLNNTGWQTLKTGLDLNTGYELVDFTGISGIVNLRMRSSTSIFETGVFTVGPELTPKVEFNCDEDFMLSWPEVSNADGYEVLRLDEGELKQIDFVSDTIYVFNKEQFDNSYFSVKPYFQNQAGPSGVTLDYTRQGVSCYFTSFFGFLDDLPAARLSLDLSTAIGIREVLFRQYLAGQTRIIRRFEPPFTNLSLQFSDTILPEGEVLYDAVIVLEDGSEIQTNSVSFFLPFKNDLYAYPNPLRRGDELKLLSRGDNLKISVYDMQGRQVFNEMLLRINDRLELPFESAGIYLIEVFRNDKPITVKKIVVY